MRSGFLFLRRCSGGGEHTFRARKTTMEPSCCAAARHPVVQTGALRARTPGDRKWGRCNAATGNRPRCRQVSQEIGSSWQGGFVHKNKGIRVLAVPVSQDRPYVALWIIDDVSISVYGPAFRGASPPVSPYHLFYNFPIRFWSWSVGTNGRFASENKGLCCPKKPTCLLGQPWTLGQPGRGAYASCCNAAKFEIPDRDIKFPAARRPGGTPNDLCAHARPGGPKPPIY